MVCLKNLSYLLPDNGESSTDFIGYVGGSLDLTESVGAYGEISLLTDETADNVYTQLKLVLSILSKFYNNLIKTSYIVGVFFFI